MSERRIVLLDLNSTLAEKFSLNTRNWKYDVSKDVYSQRLVGRLRRLKDADYEIHLITARPDSYRVATLAKIKNDVGFAPDFVNFKPNLMRKVPVHDFKYEYAKKLIASGVDPENILALESNRNTKARYSELDIFRCFTRTEYLKLNE